VNKSIF
jgi:hypothetical protein